MVSVVSKSSPGSQVSLRINVPDPESTMLVTVLCSVILSDSVALNLNYLLTNGSSWISSWLGLDRFFKCYNWLFSTFHAVDWKCGKLWKATSYSRCCLVWITEFTCHVIASVALLYPLWQTIVCLSFVTNYPLSILCDELSFVYSA